MDNLPATPAGPSWQNNYDDSDDFYDSDDYDDSDSDDYKVRNCVYRQHRRAPVGSRTGKTGM